MDAQAWGKALTKCAPDWPRISDSESSVATEREFLQAYSSREFEAPLATVDLVIFSILKHSLHLLIVRRGDFPAKGEWALPGGFVNLHQDEDLHATARRKLLEKTGLALAHIEQVQTVGNAWRDPRGWSLTTLYFALVDAKALEHLPLIEGAKWCPIGQLPPLAFDHETLAALAVQRLRNKTRYTALPMSLLPGLFTLTELQTIYETILGYPIDKKAFRRRMSDAGVVRETGQFKLAGKRQAQLYTSTLSDFSFEFPRSV
jgi:8-oxo-dGTP diphosphatase